MSRPQEFDTDAVIDAALKVLWQQGPSATCVDDLLRASGIGRSSLYNTFGGKEALLELALERYVDGQVAQLDTMLSGCTLEAGLTRMFDDLVAHNFEGRGCLLVNCTSETTIDGPIPPRLIKRGFRRLLDRLEQRVKEAQTDGEMSNATDAADIATLICVAFSGHRILHKAGVAKSRLKRSARVAIASLLQL